ncbi:MAG: sugar ABC transporter substrate-binding protein [Synergistaceae bacterium]|nr:sugar ABC transporter substrate-binding protein [Synergistaceae bacterium]
MKKLFVLFLAVLLVVASFSVAGAQGRKFGATYMTMNNPFFGVMNDAIKAAVEANGDTLITLDPALDAVKQISQIEDMVAQGVDAIFLNPVDWQAVAPGLLAAHEAGIPIVNVDAPVYDEEYVACIVASDNLAAGLVCGEDMLKRLPKGGKAVILGHPTTKSGVDRIANFKKIIEEHPEFTIAQEDSSEGQLEIAMPKMENIIQAIPDMAVVMCVNDPTALGVIQALRAANALEGVLIYGVDGSPDAKKMIKDGMMTGTAAQSPINIGKIGVEMAYKILAGEKVEKHVPVPVTLITAENVDEFGVDGWQ